MSLYVFDVEAIILVVTFSCMRTNFSVPISLFVDVLSKVTLLIHAFTHYQVSHYI